MEIDFCGWCDAVSRLRGCGCWSGGVGRAEETVQGKKIELQVAVRSSDQAAAGLSVKSAEKVADGLDLSQIDRPEWKFAIEQLAKRPGVQSGQSQLSVLRVILKEDQAPEVHAPQRDPSQRIVNGVRLFIVGAAPLPASPVSTLPSQRENLIHVSSTKLVSLDPQDAGGMLKEVKSGDFVVVEHINSTRRKDGRDPVQVGSWTHRHAELWVPVPPRGQLGVVGDLVLERVSPEEMGGVIVELDTSAVPGGSFKEMHFGPLFTGGIYGRKYQATDTGVAGTNRIAPAPISSPCRESSQIAAIGQ